ncbi:hypothetical protein BKA70DRAFT_509346 [Coprinopsis sp. MPI-PUGE-AT-0042]|nr:hypothetical protein BKA70DRAFT_509346 [Coprinopsis sp. MPI-PUGE-AT-0042]
MADQHDAETYGENPNAKYLKNPLVERKELGQVLPEFPTGRLPPIMSDIYADPDMDGLIAPNPSFESGVDIATLPKAVDYDPDADRPDDDLITKLFKIGRIKAAHPDGSYDEIAKERARKAMGITRKDDHMLPDHPEDDHYGYRRGTWHGVPKLPEWDDEDEEPSPVASSSRAVSSTLKDTTIPSNQAVYHLAFSESNANGLTHASSSFHMSSLPAVSSDLSLLAKDDKDKGGAPPPPSRPASPAPAPSPAPSPTPAAAPSKSKADPIDSKFSYHVSFVPSKSGNHTDVLVDPTTAFTPSSLPPSCPDLFVRYREVPDAATHPTPAKPWIWDQALAVSKPVVPPPSKARSSKFKAVAKELTRTKHDAASSSKSKEDVASSSKAKKQDPPSSDKIDKKDNLMQRFEADLTEACLKADRMYEEAKALQESLPVPAPVRAPSATPIAAPVVAPTDAPTPAQVPADLAAAFLAAFPVLAVAPAPTPVPAAAVPREAEQTAAVPAVDVPAKDINLDQLLQAELASAFYDIGDMQSEETSSFPSSTASTDPRLALVFYAHRHPHLRP